MTTVVERLASLAKAAREGDPVLFGYGPGIDDAFIDHAYRTCGIEETVWEALRAAGYERIVFHSPDRKLYFRDDDSAASSRSRRAAQSGSPAPASAQPGIRGMRAGFAGPFGDRVVTNFGARRPPQAPAGDDPAPAATTGGMSDPHSVRMIRILFRNPVPRTAVVFVDAAETLFHIESVRGLAEFFASRVSFQRDSPHTCVLLIREPTLEAVHEYLEGLRTVPALASYAQRQLGRRVRPGLIGHPDDAELLRLIHALRVGANLRVVDWRGLPAVVRAMSAQSEEARRWEGRLRDFVAERRPLDMANLLEKELVRSAVTDPGGVWERLAKLRGLDGVKDHLTKLRWRLTADAKLREQGRTTNSEPDSHHLVFTGNPGTGKTTVARLVGEMYRDLGVLSKGHVIEVGVGDLVEAYVGGTAQKTTKEIDRALDGVLFIDEAYQLSDQRSGFGQEAIDTLLARMENDRARLVVIVAGYPVKMREFLDANPGLRSRFPERNVIEFADYDPQTLTSILTDRLSALGLTWTDKLSSQIGTAVAGMHRTRRAGFGNARAMREIAEDIASRWSERVKAAVDEPADVPDLPDRLSIHLGTDIPEMAELLGELDAMIGLQPVKDTIRTLVHRLRLKQRRGKAEVTAPHLLFLGPPGTGKTTVARMIGRIFKSLGLLVSGQVVEVGRKDLVGEYIGHTAVKTAERIADAADGVLFIDEAYSLSRAGDGRDFGQEAIDTLNQDMENMRGQLAVIAAGYPRQMEEFLDSNPGLASRFTVRVDFPDYTDRELLQILIAMAARDDYVLAPQAQERVVDLFAVRRAARPDAFGNGRAARGLLAEMEARLAARTAEDPDADLSTFLAQDVPDG